MRQGDRPHRALRVDEIQPRAPVARHARRTTRRNEAARHPRGPVLAAAALIMSTCMHVLHLDCKV